MLYHTLPHHATSHHNAPHHHTIPTRTKHTTLPPGAGTPRLPTRLRRAGRGRGRKFRHWAPKKCAWEQFSLPLGLEPRGHPNSVSSPPSGCPVRSVIPPHSCDVPQASHLVQAFPSYPNRYPRRYKFGRRGWHGKCSWSAGAELTTPRGAQH